MISLVVGFGRLRRHLGGEILERLRTSMHVSFRMITLGVCIGHRDVHTLKNGSILERIVSWSINHSPRRAYIAVGCFTLLVRQIFHLHA